jgi:hypothetical protein
VRAVVGVSFFAPAIPAWFTIDVDRRTWRIVPHRRPPRWPCLKQRRGGSALEAALRTRGTRSTPVGCAELSTRPWSRYGSPRGRSRFRAPRRRVRPPERLGYRTLAACRQQNKQGKDPPDQANTPPSRDSRSCSQGWHPRRRSPRNASPRGASGTTSPREPDRLSVAPQASCRRGSRTCSAQNSGLRGLRFHRDRSAQLACANA